MLKTFSFHYRRNPASLSFVDDDVYTHMCIRHLLEKLPYQTSNYQTNNPFIHLLMNPLESNDQTIKRSNDQTIKRSNDQTIKRSNDQTIKRSNDQTIKRSNDQSPHSLTQSTALKLPRWYPHYLRTKDLVLTLQLVFARHIHASIRTPV